MKPYFIFLIVWTILLFVGSLLLLNRAKCEMYENTTSKKAVCFLATSYSPGLIKRINQLIGTCVPYHPYDVYLCVDKLDTLPPSIDKQTKCKLIRSNAQRCESDGFMGTVLWCRDRACSRDKALHYFAVVNTSYDHVWFVEDDVLFEGFSSFASIDKRFGDNLDLLTRAHRIRTDREPEALDWHWPVVVDKIGSPWTASMICVIRLSKRMLECLRQYAHSHKRLFLDESIFGTLCMHNRLAIGIVPEFEPVMCCTSVPDVQVPLQKGFFYHPVKKIDTHSLYKFQ